MVTVEGGWWRIRTVDGEITAEERDELIEYFNEIRFPYQIIKRRVCVPSSVSWETIEERLQHFYDDWADVCPF